MSTIDNDGSFTEAFERAKERWMSVDINYMPVYPGGQKQFNADCQTFAAAFWQQATREAELIEALRAAMRFVPKPYDMAGYGDVDAPEEVEELIGVAKLLHESAMVKEVIGK